jgi:hypothetical protein
MKKRGFAAIFLGLLATVYVLNIFSSPKRGPFSYEYGSVAGPVTTRVTMIQLSGLVLIVGGLCFCIFDYRQWKKSKES